MAVVFSTIYVLSWVIVTLFCYQHYYYFIVSSTIGYLVQGNVSKRVLFFHQKPSSYRYPATYATRIWTRAQHCYRLCSFFFLLKPSIVVRYVRVKIRTHAALKIAWVEFTACVLHNKSDWWKNTPHCRLRSVTDEYRSRVTGRLGLVQ